MGMVHRYGTPVWYMGTIISESLTVHRWITCCNSAFMSLQHNKEHNIKFPTTGLLAHQAMVAIRCIRLSSRPGNHGTPFVFRSFGLIILSFLCRKPSTTAASSGLIVLWKINILWWWRSLVHTFWYTTLPRYGICCHTSTTFPQLARARISEVGLGFV